MWISNHNVFSLAASKACIAGTNRWTIGSMAPNTKDSSFTQTLTLKSASSNPPSHPAAQSVRIHMQIPSHSPVLYSRRVNVFVLRSSSPSTTSITLLDCALTDNNRNPLTLANQGSSVAHNFSDNHVQHSRSSNPHTKEVSRSRLKSSRVPGRPN